MSEEELAKKANDFEEEHGWCPDYGYDTERRKIEIEITKKTTLQPDVELEAIIELDEEEE